MLAHYDPDKELILTCDASPVGVGAVLGTEDPIGYASRSLAPAECRYSQIDKKALAIVFGVKCYHQHLYGIFSDNKPLMYLFSENQLMPLQGCSGGP